MTIKEAKELAHASFMEAYAHMQEETNIGATANYIMLYVNNILLPHGFACDIKWKKERMDEWVPTITLSNMPRTFNKEDSK